MLALLRRLFTKRQPLPHKREVFGLLGCILAWRRSVLESAHREGEDLDGLEHARGTLGMLSRLYQGPDRFTALVTGVPIGSLEPHLFLLASWRIEAATAIAWALGLLDEIPPVDLPSDPLPLNRLLGNEGPDLLRRVRVRERAELGQALAAWKALTSEARRRREESPGEETALPFSRALERTRGLAFVASNVRFVEDVDLEAGSRRELIERAVGRAYPASEGSDGEDLDLGFEPEASEKAPPLEGVLVRRATTPVPHWHYISLGLSGDVEFTIRLADDSLGTTSGKPPPWPANLLRWIADWRLDTGEPLHMGHSLDIPPDLLGAVSPGVEGLVFVDDPELGTIESHDGRITFLDLLPLMRRERWLRLAWDLSGYLEAVREQEGDLVWRVGRPSVLEGERGRELVARAEREGSSLSEAYAALSWTDGEIVMDPMSRDSVANFLRYRIAYERSATLLRGERKVTLSPGDWRMTCTAEGCVVAVPPAEAKELADELVAAVDGRVITRPNGFRLRLDMSR